ncbi:MAG: hypothetical protein ACYTDW_21450 [Planctomycetota bacterium]
MTVRNDILVRLHEDDKEFKQELYLWCAKNGLSVHQKRDEFALMNRILIPAYMRELLARSFKLVEMED